MSKTAETATATLIALRERLASLEAQWDSYFSPAFEGRSGSPGEWLVEAMDVVRTEIKRREA